MAAIGYWLLACAERLLYPMSGFQYFLVFSFPFPFLPRFRQFLFCSFLDATTNLIMILCYRPSVPSFFRTTNMAVFGEEKSSITIVNNSTKSEDEVVASNVPS